MFELIAYIFKIVISLCIGYILGYDHMKKDESSYIQLHTTLITFFMASIIGILIFYSSESSMFMGLFLFANTYYIVNNFKDLDSLDKNKLFFSMINGFIIGVGYIFYSIIITILFSYLVNNYDVIAQLFNKEYVDLKENNDQEKNEIDINA
jgi:hypothetical protein